MATRLFFILAILGLNTANAGNHSLTYQATASSGVHHFHFMEVGLVDGIEFTCYNSNSSGVKPKQDWMTRLTDKTKYLETETLRCWNDQLFCKNLIRVVQQRFNLTGGVHIVQVMHGCEWNDETNYSTGHYQYAYDGEDFLSFDLETLSWVARTLQAESTKHMWDKNDGRTKYLRYYLKTQCPEHLKTLLQYGKSSLLRTGFYPPRAKLFWTKDGEELHHGVTIEEVLPNHDGTYQMMAELKLPDPSEDWERFTCVFQLDGVEKDLTTNLSKNATLTNWKPQDQTVPIAVSVAAVLLVAAVIVVFKFRRAVVLHVAGAVIGVFKFKRAGKSAETDSNSSEEVLNPLNPPTEAPAHDIGPSELVGPLSELPMASRSKQE
ncbi:H-2 class I histocompatibility antigen, Q7 alpha chain-like isoform X2 [Synchiropus splendidus]|uniref:H-2 class I histocompatibility antigen, Q7 alpha chain-like isoform X2 n=1 Tax=Synchiropus splendidus TaxID=270530 RepID=UPI00237E4562|nr:H-2 class I histocompatibility antigen, Q7 alpha chain-like isoform X2 [Synchiropus splendidus]